MPPHYESRTDELVRFRQQMELTPLPEAMTNDIEIRFRQVLLQILPVERRELVFAVYYPEFHSARRIEHGDFGGSQPVDPLPGRGRPFTKNIASSPDGRLHTIVSKVAADGS